MSWSGGTVADGSAMRGMGDVEYSTKDQTRLAFRKMKSTQKLNKVCADCPNTNPTWASVTYGVMLCLECSGFHRQMGVHITFVRSLDMDSWTVKQLKAMELGGNNNMREYLRKNGFNMNMMTQIKDKYAHRCSQNYRAKLEKDVEKAISQKKAVSTTIEKEKKQGTAEDDLWDSLSGDTKKAEEPKSALKTATAEATKKVAAVKLAAPSPAPAPKPAPAPAPAPAPKPKIEAAKGALSIGMLGGGALGGSSPATKGKPSMLRQKSAGSAKKMGAKKIGSTKMGTNVQKINKAESSDSFFD